MLILAADTSLPILSVALVLDDTLLGAIALEGRSSRNEKLLPAIDWLLTEAAIFPRPYTRYTPALVDPPT